MLKEFLALQQQIPDINELSLAEYIAQSIRTFDDMVDFLRDKDRFNVGG